MPWSLSFLLFNEAATTEFYSLSLHDALPIYGDFDRARIALSESVSHAEAIGDGAAVAAAASYFGIIATYEGQLRSEEHTSELQSHVNLVCRLLLEKKNNPSNTLR